MMFRLMRHLQLFFVDINKDSGWSAVKFREESELVSNMLENFTEYCSSTSLMYCILSGGVSFAVWKYFLGKYDKGELPTLSYQESELSQYLIKNCKELTKPFKPPFYARNRHIQTILSVLLPKPKYEYKREYFPMEDGGQVALDWDVTGTEKVKEDSTILVILPGLTGDNSGFKGLCKRAAEQGLRPVFFNKRGHGNSVLTTPKLQSFGDVSDFRVSVVYIHKLFPDAKMVAIGHSAGSGLLACYLGTYKDESLISAACCVSPGYDGLKLFSQPLPWPYDFLLLRGLKNLVKQHVHVLSKAVDVKHVLQSKTIKEFDYRVYCKMYGIKDMDTYWIINNPATKMWGVSVPTLCINSLTDPIFGEWVIPWNLFREKPNAFLATVKGGGHCGFLHGVSAEHWNFILGLDFLTSVTEYLLSRTK